jgi:hypothetical protein
MMAFASCTEHEDTVDTSLMVGNLYCSDGSVISPVAYPNSCKTAIGVIFWVNNNSELTTDKAFVISLENLPAVQWCDTTISISEVSTDKEMLYDGLTNTINLIDWGLKEKRNTPAVSEAYNYVKNGISGWFLPSFAQANEISVQKNILYNSFKYCEGEEFGNNEFGYWTSTQDKDGASRNAIYIILSQGRGTGSNKLDSFIVRPIIAIK